MGTIFGLHWTKRPLEQSDLGKQNIHQSKLGKDWDEATGWWGRAARILKTLPEFIMEKILNTWNKHSFVTPLCFNKDIYKCWWIMTEGNKGVAGGRSIQWHYGERKAAGGQIFRNLFIERINMNFNVKSFVSQMLIQILSLLDSSVHGILQVRILEWAAIPFSRGSAWPRDQTWVSCIAGRFFTVWATKEAPDLNIAWRRCFGQLRPMDVKCKMGR